MGALTGTPTQEIKMNKDFLDRQPREQLYIFINNDEYTILNLRNRLEKLTGCADFGNLDGTNGCCVECSIDNKELFDRCWNFRFDKK